LLSLFPFLKYGFLIDFHDILDTYDGYFKLLNNKVLTYIRLIHMVYVGNNSLQGAVLCNVLSVWRKKKLSLLSTGWFQK